jgi:hypothetical protein
VPPQNPRSSRDTEAGGVPVMDDPTDPKVGDDPTRVDGTAVPRDPGDFSDEIAAPPPPATPHRYRDDDTSPHVAPPPIGGARLPIKRKSTPIPVIGRANTDDGEDGRGVTTVMTAVELDEAIPQRNSDVIPGLIADEKTNDQARRIDYDPVDDGWGPPGTTIPPPLLGAMPGADSRNSSQIPVPDVDSAPLIVAPPAPPEPARGSPTDAAAAPSLVRALEEATSRSVQLIHQLERAQSRDEVVALMSTHLAQTHRRAGFLSIKGGELALFSMLPKPAVLSTSTLRLDRPSTLQDVVGTRLPYRGPMHDDMSRNFLTQTLGICPPEILLVPVTVRERVVGVLFGDHRLLHTFDDQLALAARAAGMALERILKSKRG